jgi:hypothetical protein
MKIYLFWDITPCSPSKVNQIFGGTGRPHLQSRRISQARNKHEAASRGLLQVEFLLRLFFDPDDGVEHLSQKHRLTFNELHEIIYQKRKLFRVIFEA